MTVAVNRLANGTVELTVTVPLENVKKAYDEVVNKLVLEAEIPGFRKGNAPRNLVEEKLDKEKINSQVVQEVVIKSYPEAVKSENIVPIIAPRIEVISFGLDKECQYKASLCEKPQVTLGDYQTELAKLKTAAKIWVPGKDEKDNQPKKVEVQEIFKVLLETCKVVIPDLLVEDEANRMLSRLIDQTQKLGMTVEQYLVAQGKTNESLRAEYTNQARQTLALEFILDSIAEKEGIKVEEAELEKIINETKDPKEQEALRNQRYYLAAILRKQKTLEVLDKIVQPIV